MYKYKFLQAGQLPREHLSFLQNLLNFLSQNIWNIVPVASITGYIKIYQCHVIKRQWHCYHQWRSALSTSIMELLLLPKFDNSRCSVTQDKEICHMIMSLWHHYHLRWSTQWNPFNDLYLLSKFDVPSLRILKWKK